MAARRLIVFVAATAATSRWWSASIIGSITLLLEALPTSGTPVICRHDGRKDVYEVVVCSDYAADVVVLEMLVIANARKTGPITVAG